MNNDNEKYIPHYNLNEQAIENVLGPSAGVVGHAVIPFKVVAGITIGSVDMHYLPMQKLTFQ